MTILSKTTYNFATKRDLDIVVQTQKGKDVVCVYSDDNSEPDYMYFINEDGTFTLLDAYLPKDIRQELPAWITSEKRLREVIDFVYKELEN